MLPYFSLKKKKIQYITFKHYNSKLKKKVLLQVQSMCDESKRLNRRETQASLSFISMFASSGSLIQCSIKALFNFMLPGFLWRTHYSFLSHNLSRGFWGQCSYTCKSTFYPKSVYETQSILHVAWVCETRFARGYGWCL